MSGIWIYTVLMHIDFRAVTIAQELTDEIGREQQQMAYQRHLGLIAYEPEVR